MKKFIKILKGFMAIVIILLVILVIANVYGFIYMKYYETDIWFINNTAFYTVVEDNMKPDYKVNDVLIIEKDYTYGIDEAIIYNYNSSYRIAKIEDISAGYYKLYDNIDSVDKDYKVTDEIILGRVKTNIKSFANIYNFMTNSTFLIVITIIVILYVLLGSGEKNNGHR